MSLVVLTFAERDYSCTNLVLCSDEGLALETSALDSLYGDQITIDINSADKTKYSSRSHRRSNTASCKETYSYMKNHFGSNVIDIKRLGYSVENCLIWIDVFINLFFHF